VHNEKVTKGTLVIPYLRISTADQASSGAGLDAQRAAIEDHCAKRGWQIIDWAEDHASGKSMSGRPELANAIERIERGQAEALVVAKLDRLARSVHDFTGLVARSQKRGWALVVIDLQLDMTEPAGKLMANILASFAEFERDLIGKRTREALAVRRAQGVRLGRQRDLPDSLVDQMVAARDEGWTYQRIADQLNTEGIRTARGGSRWHPSTIRAAIQAQARDAEG
jgi:DNA invertase Pin-like site-specific DNA recombinase